MMINKRLIHIVPNSRKYIVLNVLSQWISLISNIALMSALAYFLQAMYLKRVTSRTVLFLILVLSVSLIIRYIFTRISSHMSYKSSESVKFTLRTRIYQKLLRLGPGYMNSINTSEVIQVTVEGVEQLETYFGAYLPQFFYSMLAPLTLFSILGFISLKASLILLICVPLIPITIILVQKWAKKLLGKYWGEYTTLGDTFLENLQGLTTEKIYQADQYKHEEMNKQSERFRKITMRVLTMQLNSISIMDMIAYGGASIGMIVAVLEFNSSNVDLFGTLLIILLSAEFFLPMRLLGSFFHVAMNGMAASDKIFKLLDLNEEDCGKNKLSEDYSIDVRNLSFAYREDRDVLKNVDITLFAGSFIALVGESGCGKSTIASILMGKHPDYKGSIKIGGIELRDIKRESLMENITYISHKSYLFKGSVRENLLVAKPSASDSELWSVLEEVNLAKFLKAGNGLDTLLDENGSNLSGGQCQRLALARALLHDSNIYIFDEATSNIDVESENDIIKGIYKLAKTKSVIMISHRLLNVTGADNIYVIDDGKIVENGNHSELCAKNGHYSRLWKAQQELESYLKEAI